MPTLLGQRLGDFEIVRELGRGGMGIVYEARQISLNRTVALKVLTGLGLTPKAVERFHREAEAAAQLHHTNIVPVYTTGEQDGTHFYAMELVDGPSLDIVIRQLRDHAQQTTANPEPTRLKPPPISGQAQPSTRLDATGPYVEFTHNAIPPANLGSSALESGGSYFDTVARMLAEVADALEYAHGQGIIHRDIKPSNLLLAPSGKLSINDFGLARILEQPGMTVTGEFVGTPAYMSPEQIASGRIPLDRRTDIYSLGATLYEMLTLQAPFDGKQRDLVLSQIMHKDPLAPRRLNPRVPVDLETICLKALEKDPDRRYQSAGELAADLRRHVNRFAISARRAGPVQHLVKWVRRHPAVAATLACLLVTLSAAFAFAYLAHSATEQLEQADARLRKEQENARTQLLEEKIQSAYAAAASSDPKRTDLAIKEIESLGASAGQVRLLRGLVAVFRQDTVSAINELEQAVKLLPESVAARALLVMAYCDHGLPEKSFEPYREMQALVPTSPEDFLFKGYAREINEPGQGLADLNEGIQRRDSPLGRAMRAMVRTNRAIDVGRVEEAGAAIADADAARGMLPDNQLALVASGYARLTAAALYQDAKLPEKRAAVLKEAARDVKALEPFIGLSNPAWVIWQYHYDIGEHEQALQAARRAWERSSAPITVFYSITSLYRLGRSGEALKLLDARRQPDLMGDFCRGVVVAELPDGPRLANAEYQKIEQRYPRELSEVPTPSYLLMLLGKTEQARVNLRKIRIPPVQSQEWKDFYHARRQYWGGEISEEIFLAAAGGSRWQLCYAHYYIAMSRLARGDRAAARQHFRKAIDTRAIALFDWNFAEMFLSRLEQDPAWPAWIQ
jgi:serine/threonine protein kinase